jgi:hypothetical protein
MSAAALTDHVCDHWYGGTTSEPSISRLADAHSELGQRIHAICAVPRETNA